MANVFTVTHVSGRESSFVSTPSFYNSPPHKRKNLCIQEPPQEIPPHSPSPASVFYGRQVYGGEIRPLVTAQNGRPEIDILPTVTMAEFKTIHKITEKNPPKKTVLSKLVDWLSGL